MIRSWKISFRPDTRNFEVLLRLAAVQLRAIDAIQHGCKEGSNYEREHCADFGQTGTSRNG